MCAWEACGNKCKNEDHRLANNRLLERAKKSTEIKLHLSAKVVAARCVNHHGRGPLPYSHVNQCRREAGASYLRPTSSLIIELMFHVNKSNGSVLG